MEHTLRFSVVSQQVAFTARQFVHSGILLRYIKKETLEPDTRPMVDRLGEDLPRLVQVAAGIQHVVNPRAQRVQVEDSAQQVSTARFLETYKVSDTFRSAMNAYQGVILFQAQQSAGCHAIHSVEARLSRRLLLAEDVLGSEHVP